MRIHKIRRKMEREQKRLGLSHKDYILYIRAENEKMMAEFRKKANGG